MSVSPVLNPAYSRRRQALERQGRRPIQKSQLVLEPNFVTNMKQEVSLVKRQIDEVALMADPQSAKEIPPDERAYENRMKEYYQQMIQQVREDHPLLFDDVKFALYDPRVRAILKPMRDEILEYMHLRQDEPRDPERLEMKVGEVPAELLASFRDSQEEGSGETGDGSGIDSATEGPTGKRRRSGEGLEKEQDSLSRRLFQRLRENNEGSDFSGGHGFRFRISQDDGENIR